jgi:hypothetical protein
MVDLEVPETVKSASREERLAWHAARIAREEPVFRFFDRIDSGLTPDEIREKLELIRERIGEVENALELSKSDELTEFGRRLEDAVALIKRVRCERATILTKRFRVTSQETRVRLDRELADAKEREQHAILAAHKIEAEISSLCSRLGIEATPHLRYTGGAL